jgi:fructoselysine-6-P-deglycase FrlB-like protein
MTMDYYEAVASQPLNLTESASAVGRALATVDLAPWRSGVLAAVSMGASAHAGHALVHRLARYGRRVVNLDASEYLSLRTGASRVDIADSYLFVSEGGRSRETIDAARAVAAGARLALTNVPAAPLGATVDVVVGLGHGEDSKVYTVGYTATLQAFGLLAQALDGVDDGDDWTALPGLVSEVLKTLAPDATQVASALAGVTSLDVVGPARSRASVAEGALLLRESARIATAAYETYQYLHGPMECLTPAQGVLLTGDGREVALAHYLAGVGVRTVLITTTDVAASGNLSVLRLPAVGGALSRAVLEILPVQLVAGDLARDRGLGIDGFLYHQDDTKY